MDQAKTTGGTLPQLTRRERRAGGAGLSGGRGTRVRVGGHLLTIYDAPYEHSGDNGRVVLTCAPADASYIETKDPADRAHLTRLPGDELGRLAPAATHDGYMRPGLRARPRLYHPSQVVGRPGREVAIDSSFDAWHERLRWLVAEGLLGRASNSKGDYLEEIRLRDLVPVRKNRPRAPSPEERESARLSREADEWIRQNGQKKNGVMKNGEKRGGGGPA